MIRAISFVVFAAALAYVPASKADVVPFASIQGYSYSTDGSSILSEDSHYQTGSALAVERNITGNSGSSSFAAKADRVGSQVTLGAKASASGGAPGQWIYASGGATYSANVHITPASPPNGISVAPTMATFQVALNGVVAGGEHAWFSLFNDGAGAYGNGSTDSVWTTGDATQNLQYVENVNGGYTVSGRVDFTVPVVMNEFGVLTSLLQLSLSTGAAALEGLTALADFMDTATLVGIAFPELGGMTAEQLGFQIDFTELPFEIVAFDDRGPLEIGPPNGPGAGGQPTPEPASLLVWGAVALLILQRRRRAE